MVIGVQQAVAAIFEMETHRPQLHRRLAHFGQPLTASVVEGNRGHADAGWRSRRHQFLTCETVDPLLLYGHLESGPYESGILG